MTLPKIATQHILKVERGIFASQSDLLVVEEPMEIRIGYGPKRARTQQSLAVTMRTPGHDFELSLGFLYTEGIIRSKDEVLSIQHCQDGGKEENKGNIVRVELAPTVELEVDRLQRNFFTSSSCGLCGKASIDAVRNTLCPILPEAKTCISESLLLSLPERLLAAQATFRHTGGLHAAALFDWQGNLLLLREDIGRHNALDKLIGACLLKGLLPLHENLLFMSSRISFELVQKAVMAGLPAFAAVSAPSSLAVSLAEEFGMSLFGFVREGRFNVYCGRERLEGGGGDESVVPTGRDESVEVWRCGGVEEDEVI
jgi:FdhD protein